MPVRVMLVRVYYVARHLGYCKDKHGWVNVQKRGGDKRRIEKHTSS
jgi:hypothetical protein